MLTEQIRHRVGAFPQLTRTRPSWQLPSDEVVLRFQVKAQRPDSVELGLCRSKVRDYTESPPRRFRYQRFGRVAKHCLSKEARYSFCCGECEWWNCSKSSTIIVL